MYLGGLLPFQRLLWSQQLPIECWSLPGNPGKGPGAFPREARLQQDLSLPPAHDLGLLSWAEGYKQK
jgi:hypothetical protein